MSKPHQCPYCPKAFKTLDARYCHAKTKHKGKKIKHLRPVRDDEPSIADLMMEAQLNRSMGIKNDDWLEDMLP